ncbi:hypothetical protein Tco_1510298 [Tanacetum coccineum]
MDMNRRSSKRQQIIPNHFQDSVFDLNKKKDSNKGRVSKVMTKKDVECLYQANRECLEVHDSQGKVGDTLKECNEEVMGNLRDSEMVDNEIKVCPNQSVDVDKGAVENDGTISFGSVNVYMLKMCDGIRKNDRINEDDMQGIKEIE